MSEIKVKVKKFVNENNKRCVEILSIECKSKEELPDLYFHQFRESYCFYDKEDKELTVYTHGMFTGDKLKRYKVGEILEECYFNWLLRDLKECSEQLIGVNKYIKREARKNKKWYGIFDFKF